MKLLTLYNFYSLQDMAEEKLPNCETDEEFEKMVEYALKEIVPNEIKNALGTLIENLDASTTLKDLYIDVPGIGPVNVKDLSNYIDSFELLIEDIVLYLELSSDANFELDNPAILEFSEWGVIQSFYLCCPNIDGDMIYQGFMDGEFDTGYYNHYGVGSDHYIVSFDGDDPVHVDSGLIYPTYELFKKAIKGPSADSNPSQDNVPIPNEPGIYEANIYMKTEPAGEYTCGKMSSEKVNEFLKTIDDDEMASEFFYEHLAHEFDNLGHVNGVITGLRASADGLNRSDFNSIKYNNTGTVGFPKESDGTISDGFYVVRTATDKMSVEFNIEQEEPIDLVLSYHLVDLRPLKDLYGDIKFPILSYIEPEDGDEEFEVIDSGSINETIYVIQAQNGKVVTVYENDNGTISWNAPLDTPLIESGNNIEPDNNIKEDNVVEKKMNCNSCGNELKEGAKFCGSCGTKVEVVVMDNIAVLKCANCGEQLKPKAKFCGGCGTPATGQQVENKQIPQPTISESIVDNSGVIFWNIVPGQIALKLDQGDLLNYENAKSIIVPDGVQALVFIEGTLSALLASGKYVFPNKMKTIEKPSKNETVTENKNDKKLKKIYFSIANIIKGDRGKKVEEKVSKIKPSPKAMNLILVRDVDFPIVLEIANVNTSGIRSNIGIQMQCKVSDVNEFYRRELQDNKFVSLKNVADRLMAPVQNILDSRLSSYTPEQISVNPTLKTELEEYIGAELTKYFPYIQLGKIVRIEANNDRMNTIRSMQEELYVSEKELHEQTKRNAFINKLNTEDNNKKLTLAKSTQDFDKAMLEIDKEGMLTDEERSKFVMMLSSQKAIREAKNREEQDAALEGIRKSGMLRNEEFAVLENQIKQRKDLSNLSNNQIMELTMMDNKLQRDRQQLLWEAEVGDQRLDMELNRKVKQDNYNDDRRNKDGDFKAAERRREAELDHDEQLSQIEILKQAQAVRMDREKQEHQQEMEKQQQASDADLEKNRIYAGMSFEQIMAANPNISPEAAKALAEKFKAEASRATADDRADMAMQQKDEMRGFMEQQMGLMKDMIQSNSSAKSEMIEVKDREIERTRESSERHNDRYAQAVETTVNAVSGRGNQPTKESGTHCSNCGSELEPGSKFCLDCGTSV